MNTKVCFMCKEEKYVAEFSKNATRKDGLSPNCKACHRILRKAHYEANKEKTINRVVERRQGIKDWLQDYKKNLVCQNCGFSHPAALDFHHRNQQDKDFVVSQISRLGKSRESIMKEIEKCDVLCSNCHRIHHHNKRMHQ